MRRPAWLRKSSASGSAKPLSSRIRGGGAGNIAAEAVYHSDPDGYTLLASPGATISINDFLFKKLGFVPTEFEPVAILTSVPLALIVRQDFPAKDFKEFVSYAKANPGKINYASNGIGTAAHLTAELFMLTVGTKMTHVPYKGTAPVLNDLIAGHVDATFIQYSAFYEMHKAGKVRKSWRSPIPSASRHCPMFQPSRSSATPGWSPTPGTC